MKSIIIIGGIFVVVIAGLLFYYEHKIQKIQDNYQTSIQEIRNSANVQLQLFGNQLNEEVEKALAEIENKEDFIKSRTGLIDKLDRDNAALNQRLDRLENR